MPSAVEPLMVLSELLSELVEVFSLSSFSPRSSFIFISFGVLGSKTPLKPPGPSKNFGEVRQSARTGHLIDTYQGWNNRHSIKSSLCQNPGIDQVYPYPDEVYEVLPVHLIPASSKTIKQLVVRNIITCDSTAPE